VLGTRGVGLEVFPSTLSYIVVGVAFAFTAIVMGLVGYYYRSREIGLVAALTGLISFTFLLAFYAEDAITTVMLTTGHSFGEVYRFLLLGATVFRGGDLLEAYWLPVAWAINTVSLGVASLSLLGSYLAGEILGLQPRRSLILSLVVFVIALIGAIFTIHANNVINPFNTLAPQVKIQQGLFFRDVGNVVKLVALVITFSLITVAFIRGYRETGEKPLLYNGLSWLLLLVGFILLGLASLAWWESFASSALARGAVSVLNLYYLAAIVLTLGGAVGVLFSTVAGYVAPAVVGEAEEAETVETGE